MPTLFDDAFLKRLEVLYIISKKIFAGRLRAERKTRIVGAGIEFADYRNYAAGDDYRYVDWAVLARTERLLVRLFEEEEDLHIYFLVDESESMRVGRGEKLLYAKRLAAALAYIGLANLDRVAVVPFAERLLDRLPPARGRGQIFKVFRFLEKEYPDARRTDIRASFQSFVAQNKRPGIAVIISDMYDLAGYEEGLNLLRYARFEPMVCQVWDDADLDPSLFGDVDLIDCETGSAVTVTITADVLRAYRRAHRELTTEVEEYCRKKNLLFFQAPLAVPFDELVLKVFRAGGFLR
jgi:uncharacterized protein (DUF58 family)